MNNRPISRQTPFFDSLYDEIECHGGMFNAHLHLDRAGTLSQQYQGKLERDVFNISSMSLQEKHKRINDVHAGPAYDIEDLKSRVNFYLDVMIECSTRRADTMVDVTDDRVGLQALEILQEIKQARAHEIDLRLAAYSPLGNPIHTPTSWDLLEKGSESADFIGLLPEADDQLDYPDNIGFYTHLEKGLKLAKRLNKMVHVHTDQRVVPSEDGTEQLIKAVEEFGAPVLEKGEPAVWAVHAISPTTYDDERFYKMVEGLKTNNIGIICCPTAALGMRQIRQIKTPTDNSMPRVLELLAEGVQVRIASDNIADICSPSTTADLMDEIIVLSSALRFYNPKILGKIAAGILLSDIEKEEINEHLKQNQKEIKKLKRFIGIVRVNS